MRDPSFMNEIFLSLYSSQEDEDDGLDQKLIRHYLHPIFFFLPTIDLGHPICLLSYTEEIYLSSMNEIFQHSREDDGLDQNLILHYCHYWHLCTYTPPDISTPPHTLVPAKYFLIKSR